MKKLNSKGMTTVEILVCFVLIVIITVSLYSTVSSYKNKQQIESYKEKIYTYTNLLTKEIQDDLIKKGVVTANITESKKSGNPYYFIDTIELVFRDGSKKNLIVERRLARDYDYDPTPAADSDSEADDPNWPAQDDYFLIRYGEPGKEINYPIPDLGYGTNDDGNKVLDLRIQNTTLNTNDSILTIKIQFYHVDLPSKYGINIVCPINF